MYGHIKSYMVSRLGILLFLSIPVSVFAHVKWFVDEQVPPVHITEPTWLYALIAFIFIVFVVLIAYRLDTYVTKRLWNKRIWSVRVKRMITSVFGLVVGSFFLVASYRGFLFSMDLNHFGTLTDGMLILQGLIGVSFLVGFGVRLSAILLLVLWSIGLIVVGPLHMLEAIWVVGVGLFALIYGRSHFKTKNFLGDAFFKQYEPYALPLLRVCTGIDLIILGFSEKLLHPELALAFLSQYHWNFIHALGVEWFTDYMFVFLAGCVEVLFGLIFVLGIVTRINAIVIGIIFTIPIILLGPTDLIGHMPHFSIVLMLILFGAGDRLTIAPMKHGLYQESVAPR